METKLVIFDMDGVLLDAREIHYKAFNRSLPKRLRMSRDAHNATLDGLSTNRKLEILRETKSLTNEECIDIWVKKQHETIKMIQKTIRKDEKTLVILRDLVSKGIKVAICSNSIQETIDIAVDALGIEEYIDFSIGNDGVYHPKPAPDMYLEAMQYFGFGPTETLIVEDSRAGREAASKTGTRTLFVQNTDDLTCEKMEAALNGDTSPPKWKDSNLNIIIPLAGAGKRFIDAGYTFPKPLIEVEGKPMIQAVVENLNLDAQYHFVVREEHYKKYNMKHLLNLMCPGCNIVISDKATEGAACTILLAKKDIDSDKHLLIANCDQLMGWDSGQFMWSAYGSDGCIATFETTHPKWSFAKVGASGWVTKVAEKVPISNRGTTGVYYWDKGSDFVKYAEAMMKKNIRVNGEFYVCPVFNEAIADGKKIKEYGVDSMQGLGTPEDLMEHLRKLK